MSAPNPFKDISCEVCTGYKGEPDKLWRPYDKYLCGHCMATEYKRLRELLKFVLALEGKE